MLYYYITFVSGLVCFWQWIGIVIIGEKASFSSKVMNPNLNTHYVWSKIYGWNEANAIVLWPDKQEGKVGNCNHGK
jgi:hypothetical protein